MIIIDIKCSSWGVKNKKLYVFTNNYLVLHVNTFNMAGEILKITILRHWSLLEKP